MKKAMNGKLAKPRHGRRTNKSMIWRAIDERKFRYMESHRSMKEAAEMLTQNENWSEEETRSWKTFIILGFSEYERFSGIAMELYFVSHPCDFMFRFRQFFRQVSKTPFGHPRRVPFYGAFIDEIPGYRGADK